MGRSKEQWEKERAEGGARHEHIVPPEDVGGVRTRTGRLLEDEFGDVAANAGATDHNLLEATLDALDAYRRTRLSYSGSQPLPDEDFYVGLDEHLSAVQDALKGAQKQSKQDARDQQKAQADTGPGDVPIRGGVAAEGSPAAEDALRPSQQGGGSKSGKS